MADKKSSKKAEVKKDDIRALKERLSVLEKIQEDKLKPKSEVRVTGKQFFPLALGAFFALCSGLAVYGVASSVRFYSDYGEVSSLLISLAMLFALILLIGIATWTVHRSEWGYRLRYTVVLMIVLFSSIGIGAVLMQGPVERVVDKLGLNDRLRAEDRLLDESTVYGKILSIDDGKIKVDIMGGGSLSVGTDEDTRVFPMGTKLRSGQVVGVILRPDSNVAKWIRVLPPNHPAGKNI